MLYFNIQFGIAGVEQAACWALVRSWLDVQVDFELARLHGLDLPEDVNGGSANFGVESAGSPDAWPQPVVEQQPRDLYALFQKLVSGYFSTTLPSA